MRALNEDLFHLLEKLTRSEAPSWWRRGDPIWESPRKWKEAQTTAKIAGAHKRLSDVIQQRLALATHSISKQVGVSAVVLQCLFAELLKKDKVEFDMSIWWVPPILLLPYIV